VLTPSLWSAKTATSRQANCGIRFGGAGSAVRAWRSTTPAATNCRTESILWPTLCACRRPKRNGRWCASAFGLARARRPCSARSSRQRLLRTSLPTVRPSRPGRFALNLAERSQTTTHRVAFAAKGDTIKPAGFCPETLSGQELRGRTTLRRYGSPTRFGGQ
jgi:hypothetical protein